MSVLANKEVGVITTREFQTRGLSVNALFDRSLQVAEVCNFTKINTPP